MPRATLHFQEILALQPDLILLPITPYEVEKAGSVLPPADPRMTSAVVLKQLRNGQWMQLVTTALGESRSNLLGDYVFFSSRDQYLKQALAPGSPTEYLKSDPTIAWQSKLKQLDRDIADLTEHTFAAGIPLAITVIPRRAQAAMISQGNWPDGFDPYLFGEQMKVMAEHHHAIYIDILHDYEKQPNPENGYLLMDGHLNSDGHSLVADLLAKKLASGAVPGLTRSTFFAR